MWTFTGRVFHPAQRPPPLNGHSPSIVLTIYYHRAETVAFVVFAEGHLLQLALVTTSPSALNVWRLAHCNMGAIGKSRLPR